MRYKPPIPLIKNPLILCDINNIVQLIDKFSLQV